jgi:hypothetical protein
VSVVQRSRECSLAAICNLNGLSQEAYEALSDKVRRKHGIMDGFTPFRTKFRWIAYGIRLCRQAGLRVPEGYIASLTWKTFPAGREPDLGGKGILSLSFFQRKQRKPNSRHAVAFAHGEILESDGRRYANWEAYLEALRDADPKVHRVRIDRIFR